MKKSLCFTLLGADFKINLALLCGLSATYLLGTILPLFISVEISGQLFSPLLICGTNEGAVQIFLHSFLYFFLFPIVALVFATSFLGFALLPPAALVKGFFSALSVRAMIIEGDYVQALLIYGILLTLEAGILLLYLSQSMGASLVFFRGKGEGDSTFSQSLRQFAVTLGCMVVLAVGCGLIQYFS